MRPHFTEGHGAGAVSRRLTLGVTGRYSVFAFIPIAGFALMAYGVDQDGLLPFFEAVEGDVTRPAARDDQFPQFMLDGAPDQWMTLQHGDGFLDQSNRFRSRYRIVLGEEIGQPLEVGKRLPRIDQPRQDLAFGLAGFLPAMRALR